MLLTADVDVGEMPMVDMLTPNLFNKIGFRESIQYDGFWDESVVMDCSCLSNRNCVLCGERLICLH